MLALRMSLGRAFQRGGRLQLSTGGRPDGVQEVGIGGPEITGRGMAVEKVREVGVRLVVEGVEGEEYFEINPVFDGKPVEVLEDRVVV